MDMIDRMIFDAIDGLADWPDDFDPSVTTEEIDALKEIYGEFPPIDTTMRKRLSLYET